MDLSQFRTLRAAACDLNGQMRGKRLPAGEAEKLENDGLRMPLSALNVDLWGRDIDDSPLVFATGDRDGVLHPTERGPVPMPWLATPSSLVPMWMSDEGGAPFMGDPRHALRAVLERFAGRGWHVIAATEMEFTLVDDSGDALHPPANPVTGRPLQGHAVLSIRQLDAFDAFFTDLYEGCAAMGIPVQSATSEAGLGQFEITLGHRAAMAAADDAWLFKALARGLARRHGMAATFMAKPYPDDAGNGMHVHFSVLDEAGQNVFDDGGPEGSALLRQAVAGCLRAMPASTLVFAPHGASYDRLVPGAHAPTGAGWGYENRTAAIRIPSGPTRARRIEHRVAGGDITPYLLMAAVLGAAFSGIEDALEPPAPLTGNCYEQDLPQLAPSWAEAIEVLEGDSLMARILPPLLIENLCRTKRQELARFAELPAEKHWQSYLEAV
ncbi:glutamine synthetase family protein [Rhodosalinus sp. 5P4]|uniref:glutamine synthetase family protein n=1 Tax=Rhodosalinus sp. 5P4 TaxID=3239196 RepID=UPI003526B89D